MTDQPAEAASTDSSAGEPRFVTYEVRDQVAWIMLDRPDYANTQNYRLLGQLDDLFKRAVEMRGRARPIWRKAWSNVAGSRVIRASRSSWNFHGGRQGFSFPTAI